MGPILFILLIDDVAMVCSGEISRQLFADDLKLCTSIVSNLDIYSLQTALDRLQQRCCTWQLDVNISKCYVLYIGKNNPYAYFFNGTVIPDADMVVDLGITMDPMLTFDNHITITICKAYSRVSALFEGFSTRSLPFMKKAKFHMFDRYSNMQVMCESHTY